MVLRSKEGCHLLHIGAVLGGLKCIGTEILSVPGKIEGIRYEFPVFFFSSPAQMAETREESTPPERKVQMGTSDTI